MTLANGQTMLVPIAGPVQLLVDCAGGTGDRLVGLNGAGTGASAEYSAIKTMDDAAATTLVEARGVGLDDPTFGFIPIVATGRNAFPGGGSSTGHFYRANGSIVLRTPTTVTTVVFDLLVDDRSGAGVCRILGTATPSS